MTLTIENVQAKRLFSLLRKTNAQTEGFWSLYLSYLMGLLESYEQNSEEACK